ncbi:hypothetical protein [Photobacterium ganghwense]|uniref:hypothetical protein n=1 Tax=Photobacterium ganghwense TaxID=320778 RepID=UPI001A8C7137|nr:hypothetical protein [Photobacterium ganghwense]QSV13416.1 hypothetical protein FH974_11800 [Photobacterium ganghwense]
MAGLESGGQVRANTQLMQAKSFIYEMEEGDWVLSVGRSAVRYGVITSKPYIEREIISIVYDNETGRKVDMDKHLRRKVSWGPVIKRSELPYGLAQSLRARQTVTNLDKHWQALHHSIYPAFKANGNLYLSIKIATENDIESYAVMNLFKLLNEIEVIGKAIANGVEINNFEEVFSQYLDNGLLSVTTKAQFHSPGEIWSMIRGANGDKAKWLIPTVFAYSMLFGNSHLGFDGVIDLETRQKIWDVVISRLEENDTKKYVNKLELQMPKAKTEVLEVESKRALN